MNVYYFFINEFIVNKQMNVLLPFKKEFFWQNDKERKGDLKKCILKERKLKNKNRWIDKQNAVRCLEENIFLSE